METIILVIFALAGIAWLRKVILYEINSNKWIKSVLAFEREAERLEKERGFLDELGIGESRSGLRWPDGVVRQTVDGSLSGIGLPLYSYNCLFNFEMNAIFVRKLFDDEARVLSFSISDISYILLSKGGGNKNKMAFRVKNFPGELVFRLNESEYDRWKGLILYRRPDLLKIES